MTTNILIIDDDQHVGDLLTDTVERMGLHADWTKTLKEGTKKLTDKSYEIILLDVRMPDGSGLELIPAIRESHGNPDIIIITGYGEAQGANLAIKSGAWDYLQKPISPKKIMLTLRRVIQYRKQSSRFQAPARLQFSEIIGQSPEMQSCLEVLSSAVRNDTNVLFTGETGTGKELFAKTLHANSKHSGGDFVVVDCTALPETLVESVLFGHTKGAFTSADQTQKGLVKLAEGGTLFLDEIGEMPLVIQKKFLRVLQEHCFRPIGGRKEEYSNFRLISATNRNLDQMTKKDQFRDDLLFRLRTISIDLPPLRERPADIIETAQWFLQKICKKNGIKLKKMSANCTKSLVAYDWPGNVRELGNTMEGLVAKGYDDPIIYHKHLPDEIRIHLIRSSIIETGTNTNGLDFPKFRKYRDFELSKIEKKYLQDLIKKTSGNIKNACHISGLGRTRLYTLMKKHNVSRLGWS